MQRSFSVFLSCLDHGVAAASALIILNRRQGKFSNPWTFNQFLNEKRVMGKIQFLFSVSRDGCRAERGRPRMYRF